MNKIIDIHDTISRLKSKGEAFAVATVVRTVSVTSAKTGAKALVMVDGSISEGWIGGGCAKAIVLKTARDVINDGIARLVSIQPEDLLDEIGVEAGNIVDGVKFAKNMCPSKGTMDIFIEAVLPKPELIIFGASPVGVALAKLSRQMGFSITICAEKSDHPLFGEMLNSGEAGEALICGLKDGLEYEPSNNTKKFVIVSTQGRGDQKALKSAMQLNADFIGFVGSRKKAIKLKSNLKEEGCLDEHLAAIKAPAGLDINAITPEEIALSILAELVQVRREKQYRTIQNG